MTAAAQIHSAADARRLARSVGCRGWYSTMSTGPPASRNRRRRATARPSTRSRLRPRVLRDVSRAIPGGAQAFSAQPADATVRHRPHGHVQPFASPGADLMLARLAARHSVPLGVSTVASTPMETDHRRPPRATPGSSSISAATAAARSNWWTGPEGSGLSRPWYPDGRCPRGRPAPEGIAPRVQDAVPPRPAPDPRLSPCTRGGR